MQGITLFRRLLEDLELCVSFRVHHNAHGKTEIYLSYTEPVDLIVWVLDSKYYSEHLAKFFHMSLTKKEKVS